MGIIERKLVRSEVLGWGRRFNAFGGWKSLVRRKMKRPMLLLLLGRNQADIHFDVDSAGQSVVV